MATRVKFGSRPKAKASHKPRKPRATKSGGAGASGSGGGKGGWKASGTIPD